MTAQIPETLLYNGDRLAMCDEPLAVYFELIGQSPPFRAMSSANWRGYFGTWEIKEDRLYLVDLEGTLKTGEEVNLQFFFKDFPERVFAHWFSGQIRVTKGKLLKYVHAGYASKYEQDLFIDVYRGLIKNIEVKINGTAEDSSAQEGYQIRALTGFGNKRASEEQQK